MSAREVRQRSAEDVTKSGDPAPAWSPSLSRPFMHLRVTYFNTKIAQIKNNSQPLRSNSTLLVLTLFLCALAALLFVFYNFPPLTPYAIFPRHNLLHFCIIYNFSEQKSKFRLPRDIESVKELASVLAQYRDDYYLTVLFGYSLAYILYEADWQYSRCYHIFRSLQTFCIPGSLFLSFLGGTLFGLPKGVLLVCFVRFLIL